MIQEVVIGIDLGTGGARAMAVTADGTVVAEAQAGLKKLSINAQPGFEEQDPEDWLSAVFSALRELTTRLGTRHRPISAAVDATSGTITLIDSQGLALSPGLMHNDTRAAAQSAELTGILGLEMSPTFALPKLLWLKRHAAEAYARADRMVHQADYIVGHLTGDFGISDWFNVLKTGYDLERERWPGYIEKDLGVPLRMLPTVVKPGQPIGRVMRSAAERTGLPVGMPVLAGATDSNAAFFASGASRIGDWNSSLGTTLAFKGLAEKPILDPLGRIYNHRHPDGPWLPGGASNTGADWINAAFAGKHESYSSSSPIREPAHCLVYPLARLGERFPFLHNQARGFALGGEADRRDLFQGHMEGVAYLERWGYEILAEFGAPLKKVFATGGGARNPAWLQIRANALDRGIARAACPESAMGAAILAATGAFYPTVSQASRHMVRMDLEVAPQPAMVEKYQETYGRFRQAMSGRGYA